APFDLGGDPAPQRPVLEQMLTSQPLPADVRTTPADLGGIPVLLIDIAGADPRGTIFHIHGGGFALGSPAAAAGLASALARKTGMRAVCAGYRLPPQHPHPPALPDLTPAHRPPPAPRRPPAVPPPPPPPAGPGRPPRRIGRVSRRQPRPRAPPRQPRARPDD